MPVYEYACTACGERTEAKQSFDDPPLETCPVCGGRLRKLFSPVGIMFKGTGFYSTDSRKAATSKAKSKPSSETSDSTASKSSTTEGSSKPASGDREKSA
jgi:putative FmdB family regulatory protein